MAHDAPQGTETALSRPTGEWWDGWTPGEIAALRDGLSDWGRRAFDNYRELANDATNETARTFWRNRATLVLDEPPF